MSRSASIVADIAGNREAAERFELVLPETRVSNPVPVSDGEKCCRGGRAQGNAAACCVADEAARGDRRERPRLVGSLRPILDAGLP